jgi:hypothetical protein
VWNRREFKLTIMIMECSGLFSETLSPFVKIVLGKHSLETKTVKGTAGKGFRLIFFLSFFSLFFFLRSVFGPWHALNIRESASEVPFLFVA